MAGMIGAGKSTYTEMISRRLGTEAFFESVDYNPILDKFYDNPQKWAFSLQIYFLNTRFRSIKAALTDDNNVLDRSIYEDALFTRVNHLQGNISQEEMDIYNDLLENMMEELEGMPKKAPDLPIYLDGSFETILIISASAAVNLSRSRTIPSYWPTMNCFSKIMSNGIRSTHQSPKSKSTSIRTTSSITAVTKSRSWPSSKKRSWMSAAKRPN